MSRPDELYKEWWHDRSEGIGLTTALDTRLVYETRTSHHRIEVLAHDGLGWALAIDGVLQAVEQDSAEREMRIHVPLLGRLRRQCRVLLLGGGDGAILHEVLRHTFVTEVVLCEPETALMKVGTDYLGFGSDLRDPRVTVRELDPLAGLAWSREHDTPFDLIVPVRPDGAQRSGLFQGIVDCLAKDGVCVDADPIVLGLDEIRWYRDLPAAEASGRFRSVADYLTTSPLTPGGFIGFRLYSLDGHSYAEPQQDFSGDFYNPRLHRAAFAPPSFMARLSGTTKQTEAGLTEPRQWWHEQTFGTGITQALDMRRIHAVRSEFQEIEVYEHRVFGRVLVLDGTVQLSQADEFIYHEMAVHVPLLGRTRRDVKVLIIGGGDGGILREALRHPAVASVEMVEIDPLVVEVSNKYIGIEGDYRDPRVKLHFADGVEYMAQAARAGGKFDLIVVDATDSTSPSKTLWSARFYNNLAACLAENGVCVDSDILTWTNGQPHLSRDPCEISVFDIAQSSRYFAGVESYFTKVPLYPGGYFAFFLYTKDGHSHEVPTQEHFGRYYNPALHRAAFALPTYWQALMDRARETKRGHSEDS